ncbi:carotenoid biosynthesis protein [Wenyingzhuangia sp. IMCC45574]
MNISIFKKFKFTSLALISLYFTCVILKNFLNVTFKSNIWTDIVILIPLVISVFHCKLWYNKKTTLIFFLITFMISWSMESLSIETGFPFGNYYYTDKLLVKLGKVPILIVFSYFSVGYLSWVLSHIICNRMTKNYSPKDMFLIPSMAAFFMVSWNLTFTPLNSTIIGLWTWKNGGNYFGVPIQNFVAWYFCMLIIYTLFFLYTRNKQYPSSYKFSEKFWFYPLLTYIVISLDSITYPIKAILKYDQNKIITIPKYKTSGDVTQWLTHDIYYSLALISFFTIMIIGAMLIVFLYRQPFHKIDE